MYEIGNQKDRDKKRVVLRDPRGQRGRNAACKSAESAECTGCRNRICRTVPCHRTRCRTRGIILNRVVKFTKIRCFHQTRIKKNKQQRPAGRCLIWFRVKHKKHYADSISIYSVLFCCCKERRSIFFLCCLFTSFKSYSASKQR